MGVNKPLSINQSSDRIGGGGCWRDPTTRRNCVTKGEGAAGGETKDEIRRRGGGGGGDANGYKLLNGRHCKRWPLDKFNKCHSQRRPLGIF